MAKSHVLVLEGLGRIGAAAATSSTAEELARTKRSAAGATRVVDRLARERKRALELVGRRRDAASLVRLANATDAQAAAEVLERSTHARAGLLTALSHAEARGNAQAERTIRDALAKLDYAIGIGRTPATAARLAGVRLGELLPCPPYAPPGATGCIPLSTVPEGSTNVIRTTVNTMEGAVQYQSGGGAGVMMTRDQIMASDGPRPPTAEERAQFDAELARFESGHSAGAERGGSAYFTYEALVAGQHAFVEFMRGADKMGKYLQTVYADGSKVPNGGVLTIRKRTDNGSVVEGLIATGGAALELAAEGGGKLLEVGGKVLNTAQVVVDGICKIASNKLVQTAANQVGAGGAVSGASNFACARASDGAGAGGGGSDEDDAAQAEKKGGFGIAVAIAVPFMFALFGGR